jgi:hypothetical protein
LLLQGGPFNGNGEGDEIKTGSVIIFLKKLAEEAKIANLTEGDVYSVAPQQVGGNVREALTQEMIRSSSVYGFCSMVNWFLSKYAAEADLHAAATLYSRLVQLPSETPEAYRNRLELSCGMLFDRRKVNIVFMAGVSVEARAAINGVVLTLTAEADPEVLIKVAESGDISRRHRYGFRVQRRNPESSQRTTRTFENRSETPRTVNVAEMGSPLEHRDYVATGTGTGPVQDVREDRERDVLSALDVLVATESSGALPTLSPCFLCWDYGHFLKDCIIVAPLSLTASLPVARPT